jgi:hypothetical protein
VKGGFFTMRLWDGILNMGSYFSERDFNYIGWDFLRGIFTVGWDFRFSAWDFIMGWDFLKGIFTMGWDVLTSTMGFSYISKVKELYRRPS